MRTVANIEIAWSDHAVQQDQVEDFLSDLVQLSILRPVDPLAWGQAGVDHPEDEPAWFVTAGTFCHKKQSEPDTVVSVHTPLTAGEMGVGNRKAHSLVFQFSVPDDITLLDMAGAFLNLHSLENCITAAYKLRHVVTSYVSVID